RPAPAPPQARVRRDGDRDARRPAVRVHPRRALARGPGPVPGVRSVQRRTMTALGLALLVIGAALAVVEAHVASYGILGALAVVALAVGAGVLVDAAGGGIALGLAVGLAAGG